MFDYSSKPLIIMSAQSATATPRRNNELQENLIDLLRTHNILYKPVYGYDRGQGIDAVVCVVTSDQVRNQLLNWAADFCQHSVLWLEPVTNESPKRVGWLKFMATDNLEFLGEWREVPRSEAALATAYTYDPQTDTYYMCAANQ